MGIAVLASTDPGLVTGQAGEMLAADPVGHNVVGTKLADAVRYREAGRYWIGLIDGVPAGIAVQQPADTALAVAPMPAELITAIAHTVEKSDVELPAVFGPTGPASRFAEMWAGLRNVPARATADERVYEVLDLRPPDGVAGALRRAAEADRELLLSWLPGYESGARWAASAPAAIFVTRRLAAGEVWIWEDGGPACMAARTEAVAGVSRIQAVNTPPELRGRGYASAAVAALSASVLAQGLRCVLNANQPNIAATHVYQRLGYRTVSDVYRYELG